MVTAHTLVQPGFTILGHPWNFPGCLHANMTSDFLEPGSENDHVNMRIVDIQYTITVIVYYSARKIMWYFYLYGPHQGCPELVQSATLTYGGNTLLNSQPRHIPSVQHTSQGLFTSGKTTPRQTSLPLAPSLKVTRGQTTLSEYVCENGWPQGQYNDTPCQEQTTLG